MGAITLNLLLISGGKHPYGETTPVLAGFLKEAGHKVDISESALELAVSSLDGYDAVVLNTLRTDEFGNNLKEGQRENLRKWVEDGGGLVSIHISPASCPDWPEMKKLTGGGWVFGQSHHPPFGRFTMEITDSSHPCATGLSDFRIDDEAYCDLDIQPGIEVFMSTVVEGK
ncbi:MAG: ThuA domain-containing protein, partial [Chloroflexota bacterium]